MKLSKRIRQREKEIIESMGMQRMMSVTVFMVVGTQRIGKDRLMECRVGVEV